jgi:ABC-type polysaccharide/polyol phosphate export permease
MTPILFPLEWVEKFPLLAGLIRWANPFTPFTLAYQDLLFRGAVPEAVVWAHMAAWAAVFWVIGAWIFERLRGTLVEAV